MRYGISRGVSQERTDTSNIGPRLQKVGQARDRVTGDSHVVVQAKNVIAFGGTQPDIQRFGESEVLRQAAEPEEGKLLIDGFRAVPRSVIDKDNLMFGAERFEVLAKPIDPIEGNDDDGDARRLALGNFQLEESIRHFTGLRGIRASFSRWQAALCRASGT